MITNGQAALQAAATVYSGGRGYSGQQVLDLADQMKAWLDKHEPASKAPVHDPTNHRDDCPNARYASPVVACTCVFRI